MPNGSFEEYSECPTGNEINNGQFERAIGWFRPTNSTPDYFHRCNNSINGIVGVPNNFWGYQEPFQGDGFIGFGAMCWEANGTNIGNEYVRCELKTVLKPCAIYHFTMYISLANESTHGVGRIGVSFLDENNYNETYLELSETPQIINNSAPIIDTMNWTKVEGEYVASGFEQYLTIGYFRNTVNSDTSFIQNSNFGSCAYFYLDSVLLVEVGSVSEELCEEGDLQFTNIITPNNDDSNDLLDASKYFILTDEIVILNRWGNVITTLTEDNPIWDGSTKDGKPCSEGTYFYKFEYQWGDKLKQKSGFIHLVR